MDITPIEEVNENENISELLDNAEELVGVVEQDIVIAGVRSINGKAGDLSLKTINNTDLLTTGNIDLQLPLVAGDNIQIAQDGKTISATDTKYTAGTGIELTGTEFSIDTDVVATQAELDNKQDKLTQTQLNAVNSGIDETKVAQIATNTGNITSNTNRITTIENKIPSTATSSNKLTDKDYVDNAIATNTANYISDNGQPFQSYDDLVAYSGTLTNNDYAFVESHDSAGNDIYTRYKYNADLDLWAEEYTISNPTFTSDQWASINSGVTANDVSQIGTNKSDIANLQSGKQDALSQTQLDAVNSGIDATKVQQIATNASDITNLQNDKQDKLIAGTNIQIASDGKTISATDTKYTAGTGLTLTGTQFSVTEPVPSGFFTDTQGTQTGEGTQFTLNNTTDAPIDGVELKGNTTQNTLTGKNKLGYNYASVKAANSSSDRVWNDTTKTMSYHGVDYKINDDGSILASGTASSDSFLNLVNPLSGLVSSTEYIMNGCPTGGSASTYSLSLYTGGTYVWDDGAGRQFTYDSQDIVRVNISSGTALPTGGLLFKPMIRLASVADDTYELYVGGVPSPNPDYPQDIDVVTGEQTVKVVGKNLLPVDGGYIKKPHSTSADVYDLDLNGTFTVSAVIYAPQNSAPGSAGGIGMMVDGIWRYIVIPQGSLTAPTSVSITRTGHITKVQFTSNGTAVNSTYNEYSNIQLEAGSTATTYQPYQSQTYKVNLGKNLFDKTNVEAGKRLDSSGGLYSDQNYFTTQYIEVTPNTKYAYSRSTAGGGSSAICYYKSDKTFISRTMPLIAQSDTSGVFTPPTEAKYVRICDLNTLIDSVQFEAGSIATTYAPYFTPIELCKIGDYQDYIWKDGADWKVHKAIHKILLKGTENWSLGSMFYCTDAIPGTKYAIAPTNGNIKSDYFTYFAGAGAGLDPSIDIVNGYVLRIRYSAKADVSALTTWLSTHNTTVYYALATATDTTITDASLITQLEALASSTTYAPQTNYNTSTPSPNLPTILTVDTFKDNYAGLLARLEKAGA